MYEIFEQLLQKHNVSAYKVAKETGVTQTALSNWKAGRSTPKTDTMQKLANYFGETVDYLNTGKRKDGESDNYYLNDYTRQLAQFAFENPDYRVLFDASRKTTPEDFELILKMMERVSVDDQGN